MKICILSMQEVQNFGSLLQAYQLKKIIKEYVSEVAFISIEPNQNDNELLREVTEEANDEIEYYSDSALIKKVKKVDRYVLNRLVHKIKSRQQFRVFDSFRDEYIGQSKNKDYFDLCIIGSDEVFNCLEKSRWGFTSQLFGNVYQANKVITYAASCGASVYQKLPSLVKKRIVESLNNISAFSVRDANTRSFIKELLGDTVEINEHFDPVLIGDFKEEIESAELPCVLSKKKYCLVYSYDNRIRDKKVIRNLLKLCKENGLLLFSVGAPQFWINNHVVLTPFQLLKAFSCADFVLTDTFHGTIFSAKYAKKYAYIVRNSNRNKLNDLACRLNITNHELNNGDDIRTLFSIMDDKSKLRDVIEMQRKKTMEYLLNNINIDMAAGENYESKE